ncbi:MAG: hypothetical protein AVDCRST_MAG59-3552, partial [uncultured Thermomicrobiales bacterium]
DRRRGAGPAGAKRRRVGGGRPASVRGGPGLAGRPRSGRQSPGGVEPGQHEDLAGRRGRRQPGQPAPVRQRVLARAEGRPRRRHRDLDEPEPGRRGPHRQRLRPHRRRDPPGSEPVPAGLHDQHRRAAAAARRQLPPRRLEHLPRRGGEQPHRVQPALGAVGRPVRRWRANIGHPAPPGVPGQPGRRRAPLRQQLQRHLPQHRDLRLRMRHPSRHGGDRGRRPATDGGM